MINRVDKRRNFSKEEAPFKCKEYFKVLLLYAEKKYSVENKEDLLKNIQWLIHRRINIEHFLNLLPVIIPPRILRNSKSFFEFTLALFTKSPV